MNSARLALALTILAPSAAFAASARVWRAPTPSLTRSLPFSARRFGPNLGDAYRLDPIPTLAPQAAVWTPAVVTPANLGAKLDRFSVRVGRDLAADRSGLGGKLSLDGVFDDGEKRDSGPVKTNDEGVDVFGRARIYYEDVRRLVAKLAPKIDLSESLDVMDDSYGDVRAKLKAVEAIAKERAVSHENTHLDETLTWVDAVLTSGGKRTAVNTHRVFFHRAKNPKSEIAEGIRRVDSYIDSALKQFKKKGAAEDALGALDEVVLVFDSRGYAEIKAHIQKRYSLLPTKVTDRIRFEYLDELVEPSGSVEQTRAEVNDLVARYHGQDGLEKIIEGVTYSRYVGLLLELNTIDYYLSRGYKILQSGREIFDENGHYITELDLVVQAPDGRIILVEAKSARVRLDPDEVLADKVLYKLVTYRKHRRAKLAEAIGRPFDAVVFSMDVGGPSTMKEFEAIEDPTPSQQKAFALAEYLRANEQGLKREYGFPVSFLFLKSGPELPPKFLGR